MEARERLAGIADAFLVHDRPIERPVDDSVVQWLDGAPRMVRRSRGYAPLPIASPRRLPPILAVGGHLKNTIALARGPDVFLSQHIGDLETPQARDAVRAHRVACFLLDVVPHGHRPRPPLRITHPPLGPKRRDSASGSRSSTTTPTWPPAWWTTRTTGPALGVVWDGTGLGRTARSGAASSWLGDAGSYRRVAHLRPFRLPGGDAAVREPRRWRWRSSTRVGPAGRGALWQRLAGPAFEGSSPRASGPGADAGAGFRAPWTTSAGRLFDGVACAAGAAAPGHVRGRGRHGAGVRRGSGGHRAYPTGSPVDALAQRPGRSGRRAHDRGLGARAGVAAGRPGPALRRWG
jgi:hydrogenase maturation protein HypF